MSYAQNRPHMNVPVVLDKSNINALAEAAMNIEARSRGVAPYASSSSLRTISADAKVLNPSAQVSSLWSMPDVPSASGVQLSSSGHKNTAETFISLVKQHSPRVVGDSAMAPVTTLTNAVNQPVQAYQAAFIPPSADSTPAPVQSQSVSTAAAPSRRRKPNFAEKLHMVLSNKFCRRAITWLPSGRSFCITDQEEFVKSILPRYFREAKFESFSRRLKRWGFRKVYTTGMSQMIFSHDMFHRDKPELCKSMNGRVAASKAMKVEGRPDQHISETLQANPIGSHDLIRHQLTRPHDTSERDAIVRDRQDIRQISTDSLRSLGTFPPSREELDCQAMMAEARAIVARSMPATHAVHPFQRASPEDPNIQQAKMQLGHLSVNIANCEEQLAILRRLQWLKDEKLRLTGARTSGPL
ncbi:hypothetical protein ACHAWF_007919 [Thalassiosira exigua]